MNALKDYFKYVISFRMVFHSEWHFIQNGISFKMTFHLFQKDFDFKYRST